jgi:PAS domain S-box-containing protein
LHNRFCFRCASVASIGSLKAEFIFIIMVTLPGPESASLHKPLVEVIGDFEDVPGVIESCKDRKIFFGYSPDAKVIFEDFVVALHPEDRDRTMKAIEESIRDGVPYDIEYRVLHPDGTVRWISAIGRTFRDDLDRPTRMGGVARDVTETRQFDEELQENQFQLRTAPHAAELARREAETAPGAKDQFLAVLGNEFRTPLTPIMMAADWLRNAPELAEPARNAL